MRISDWSSDVCSSDLDGAAQMRHRIELRLQVRQRRTAGSVALGIAALRHEAGDDAVELEAVVEALPRQLLDPLYMAGRDVGTQLDAHAAAARQVEIRSEERRVGKECVSKCRYRGSPNNEKKKNE